MTLKGKRAAVEGGSRAVPVIVIALVTCGFKEYT
jgi:hypothetical protein